MRPLGRTVLSRPGAIVGADPEERVDDERGCMEFGEGEQPAQAKIKEAAVAAVIFIKLE